MSVMLLIEHHLRFLSLKGGCTGSSESTLVKMRRWKSSVMAHMLKASLGPYSTKTGHLMNTWEYRANQSFVRGGPTLTTFF